MNRLYFSSKWHCKYKIPIFHIDYFCPSYLIRYFKKSNYILLFKCIFILQRENSEKFVTYNVWGKMCWSQLNHSTNVWWRYLIFQIHLSSRQFLMKGTEKKSILHYRSIETEDNWCVSKDTTTSISIIKNEMEIIEENNGPQQQEGCLEL